MVSIWETVETVKQAITEAVALINTKDDDAAKRFTGIDLVSNTKYTHPEGVAK